MSVTIRLCQCLAQRGDEPAFLTQDGQILSATKLRNTILRLAAQLAAHGVRSGDRVLTYADNRDLRLFLLLAAVLHGADAVSAPDPEALRNAGLEVDWIIAFADQAVDHPNVLRFDPSWLDGALPATLPPGGGRVIYGSSGSTGRTKFMAASDQALDVWTRRKQATFTPDYGNRLITVPLIGAFGLSYLLEALVEGHAVMGARPDVAETLAAARDFDVREVLVPPMVLADIVAAKARGAACPDFRRVFCAGAIAGTDLLERARAGFPDTVFALSYGTSETGYLVYGEIGSDLPEIGWAGYFAGDVEVELRDRGLFDESGADVGRLAVRVPPEGRVDGYLGGGEVYEAGGWFATGDLARIDDDGALVVVGRVDFLINLGGAKYAPEMIEMISADAPGVGQIAAARLAGAPVGGLDLLVVPGDGFDAAALKLHVCARLDVTPKMRVTEVAALPRLPNGKLDRVEVSRILSKV